MPVPDDYAVDTGPLQGIYVGVNGICDTTANDQAIGCIPSFTSGLEDYLNDTIFNQCVTSFEVTSGTIEYVNYDLDRNGKLNYTSQEERNEIVKGAKDTSFDYNVFVVFDIYDPEEDVRGFGNSPGHYSWVEFAVTQRSVAHELGHNVGGLGDLYDEDSPDLENLMHYYDGVRLRYWQWDACNPREDPGDY